MLTTLLLFLGLVTNLASFNNKYQVIYISASFLFFSKGFFYLTNNIDYALILSFLIEVIIFLILLKTSNFISNSGGIQGLTAEDFGIDEYTEKKD